MTSRVHDFLYGVIALMIISTPKAKITIPWTSVADPRYQIPHVSRFEIVQQIMTSTDE
jgi:hypothetical protein